MKTRHNSCRFFYRVYSIRIRIGTRRCSHCPVSAFRIIILFIIFIIFFLTNYTCKIAVQKLFHVEKYKLLNKMHKLPFFIRRISSDFVVKSSFPPKSWNPISLSIAIPFLKQELENPRNNIWYTILISKFNSNTKSEYPRQKLEIPS